MPPIKYNTDEERKEAHRVALKYARKNMSTIVAYNKQRYTQNRDTINVTRREKYASKKALAV
jgi:Flp pilus assembly protein TadG